MPRLAKTAFRKHRGRPLRKYLCRIAMTIMITLMPVCVAAPAAAVDWAPLAERLAAEGFNRQDVEALFARPEILFEADTMTGKIRELLQSRAVDTETLAALKTAVRRDVLDNRSIARALAYTRENGTILDEIQRRYEVPKEVVVAIVLIETRLGQNIGQRRVFNRLASMARCADLEFIRPYLDAALITPENEAFARERCREKADWAYSELKALLHYARRDNIDPLDIRGSMYGAIGLCQFMPSNVFAYGVDADQDGRIDPFATPDALHSIANYLREHGWRKGLDREGQHRVIFAYNHSTVYANTVLAVAEKIRR
jgi:membrane-bound lytic murein transglycosylase B